MFLDQILRRQEEYRRSLGPIKKPTPVEANKPARVKKAPPKLRVVPPIVEELHPYVGLVEPTPLLLDSTPALPEPVFEAAQEAIEEITPEVFELVAELIPAIDGEPEPVVAELIPATTQAVEAPKDIFDLFVELNPTPIYSVEPTDLELKELEEIQETEELDSGEFEVKPAFDLEALFAQYVPKKGVKVPSKTMGLPVPEELHERMVKFLAANKQKPGSPQSLKDLGLMCLGFAMDSLEVPQSSKSIL